MTVTSSSGSGSWFAGACPGRCAAVPMSSMLAWFVALALAVLSYVAGVVPAATLTTTVITIWPPALMVQVPHERAFWPAVGLVGVERVALVSTTLLLA